MPKLTLPEPPTYSRGKKKFSYKSLFLGSRFFGFLDNHVQSQLDEIALSHKELTRLEPILEKLKLAYDGGNYLDGIQMAAKLKLDLGQFYLDQQPSGWILYCEGACFLETGDHPSAYKCFEEANQAIEPPDAKLIRRGVARASFDQNESQSNLVATYLIDPVSFASNSTNEEVQLVRNQVVFIEESRTEVEDDPEVALRSALEDRFAQELRAYELSNAASKFRAERHILCEEDNKAKRQYNQEYREILLKWFTTPRQPNMGSYSSDPDEDLKKLKSLETVDQSEELATFVATFDFMGTASKYRYLLNKSTIPLGNKAMWRIHEIWSLWDDGDIQLY